MCILLALVLPGAVGHVAGAPLVTQNVAADADALPNGVSSIPDCDHKLMSVFSFAEGRLKRNPWYEGEDPNSESEFFEKLRREEVGDVLYDDAEGGTLIVVSQEALSLGKGRLEDTLIRGHPRTKRVSFLAVKVGDRFLVKCIDGNFALIRVRGKDPSGLAVEWIYQPDGGAMFAANVKVTESHELHEVSVNYSRMRDVVRALRKHGIRVCVEYDANGSGLGQPQRFVAKTTTLASLLDEVCGKLTGYQWKVDEGTGIVSVHPASESALSGELKKRITAKDKDWREVVGEIGLREADVAFPPIQGFGPFIPLPARKAVSVTITQERKLRDALLEICGAYGSGMYYELWERPGGGLNLYFMMERE